MLSVFFEKMPTLQADVDMRGRLSAAREERRCGGKVEVAAQIRVVPTRNALGIEAHLRAVGREKRSM